MTDDGRSPSGRAAAADAVEPISVVSSKASIPNAERILAAANAPSRGPWEAREYGYEKHAILDARGTDIGFAHRRNDARLIAAAPELYEALESFAFALSDADDEQTMELLAVAHSVLAKARGEVA